MLTTDTVPADTSIAAAIRPRTRPLRFVAAAATAITAVAVLSACAGPGDAAGESAVGTVASGGNATTGGPGDTRTGAAPAGDTTSADATAAAAFAVVRASSVTVRATPADDGELVTTLSDTTALGSHRVLAVDATVPPTDGWVPVLLPTRPNGSTGWVSMTQVEITGTSDKIVVDLAAHRLHLQRQGRPEIVVPVATGSPDTPTPSGLFYVTDRLRPSDPAGAYGPFALGISAHSPTLQSFGDGDAQIGIHGTSDPSSIGLSVTHGCIRLSNDAATVLAEVPLGTPVLIS